MCFTLANIDERFVAHDLFSLVQLPFELRGDFLFLSSLEILESLFHLNFELERRLFLQEVQVGFVGQPLVAKMSVDFRHDRLSCGGLTGLEFKVKSFDPILLIGSVLRFQLLAEFGLTLVAIAGKAVLNLGLTSVSVRTKFVLHTVLEFCFNFGLQAS